jgi:hypothetical protein
MDAVMTDFSEELSIPQPFGDAIKATLKADLKT